jgi:pimeloyl-ACP methyl ester carboxylesterase
VPATRVTPRSAGIGTRVVILPDGRAVEFAVYGDPAGPPVVGIHPVPGSHADWLPSHPAAARIGVLLVAPDRPGCGRSDPLPDGAVLDWPSDVAVLVEAIGLTTFGVLGVGDGGPLAAACARALADRVTCLGLVGGPHAANGLALPRRHWRARPLDGGGLAPVYRWLRGASGPAPDAPERDRDAGAPPVPTTGRAQHGESADPHAGPIETPRIPCGDPRSEPDTEPRRPSP